MACHFLILPSGKNCNFAGPIRRRKYENPLQWNRTAPGLGFFLSAIPDILHDFRSCRLKIRFALRTHQVQQIDDFIQIGIGGFLKLADLLLVLLDLVLYFRDPGLIYIQRILAALDLDFQFPGLKKNPSRFTSLSVKKENDFEAALAGMNCASSHFHKKLEKFPVIVVCCKNPDSQLYSFSPVRHDLLSETFGTWGIKKELLQAPSIFTSAYVFFAMPVCSPPDWLRQSIWPVRP